MFFFLENYLKSQNFLVLSCNLFTSGPQKFPCFYFFIKIFLCKMFFLLRRRKHAWLAFRCFPNTQAVLVPRPRVRSRPFLCSEPATRRRWPTALSSWPAERLPMWRAPSWWRTAGRGWPRPTTSRRCWV